MTDDQHFWSLVRYRYSMDRDRRVVTCARRASRVCHRCRDSFMSEGEWNRICSRCARIIEGRNGANHREIVEEDLKRRGIDKSRGSTKRRVENDS